MESGGAFKCFCTAERLATVREEQRARGDQPRYDGHCRTLSPSAVAELEAAGVPHVVRLIVPEEGICSIEDMARGTVEIAWSTVDMQVLVKSDGMPTYHLANVVDDHLMGITHVMRGEEWIPSAPKHQLLYRYFGWEMPQLMHLPLLRNPDKSKLSKRKNPTSVIYYERMGYLPDAMVNFLGMFGLSEAEGDEKMPLDEMIRRFDVANISLGGPVFDTEKLNWLNSRYIRDLSPEGFRRAAGDWAVNETYLARVAALAQSRTTVLSDLGTATAFLFAGRLGVEEARLLDGKLDRDTVRRGYQTIQFALDGIEDWTADAINAALRRVADAVGAKFRDMVRHVYVAITGAPVSLPLFDSMELLGRDLCRERLREAIAALGGVSNKEQKAWRTEWDRLGPPREPETASSGGD